MDVHMMEEALPPHFQKHGAPQSTLRVHFDAQVIARLNEMGDFKLERIESAFMLAQVLTIERHFCLVVCRANDEKETFIRFQWFLPVEATQATDSPRKIFQ